MRQTPNNFIIIKSITIIFMYVSWLKKKSLLFSLLSHTLIIFFKGGNTLLSPFYFLLHAQLSFLAVFFFSKWLPLGCSLFSCAAILVATLTFSLCVAIPFLYLFNIRHTLSFSSLCSTHLFSANHIYI